MEKDIPTIEQLEEAAIRKALAETSTRQEAADALGISVRTLHRRLNKYDLHGANLGFGGSPAGEDGLLADVLDR